MATFTTIEEINAIGGINNIKAGDIIVPELLDVLFPDEENVIGSAEGENFRDNTFVPDMSDRQVELTQAQRLHSEAGDSVEPIVKPSKKRSMSNISTDKPVDGMHSVRIGNFSAKMAGRNGNGDYRIITFVDDVAGCEFNKLFTEENEEGRDLWDFITEINKYNHAFLASAEEHDIEWYLHKMAIQKFNIWTFDNAEKNRIDVYTNEYCFNKYALAKITERKEREAEYARKKKEKEEAQKAIQRACLPWD